MLEFYLLYGYASGSSYSGDHGNTKFKFDDALKLVYVNYAFNTLMN